jgi:hypothetical protein
MQKAGGKPFKNLKLKIERVFEIFPTSQPI